MCFRCVGETDSLCFFHPIELSQISGLSIYRTRKILKELKSQGLIRYERRTIKHPEEGNFILSGYTITSKAKERPEYANALEKKRCICLDSFGIDITNPRRFDL